MEKLSSEAQGIGSKAKEEEQVVTNKISNWAGYDDDAWTKGCVQ